MLNMAEYGGVLECGVWNTVEHYRRVHRYMVHIYIYIQVMVQVMVKAVIGGG